MVTFVQAIYVLATFVHISNISAVNDPILTIKARSRKDLCKGKARSGQGQGNVKARSKKSNQGNINARSMKGQGKVR